MVYTHSPCLRWCVLLYQNSVHMFCYSPAALPLRHLGFSSLLSALQYWAKDTNCESHHYVTSPIFFFILFLTAPTHPVLLWGGAWECNGCPCTVLFFPYPKNTSPLTHGFSPDHLVFLNVITELIFGEKHKLCSSWCFLFMAFQILCALRIYFKFHQMFKVLLRNVATFVKVLQRIQILFYLWMIYKGLKYYHNCKGFTKYSNFTMFVMNLARIQILPHLWRISVYMWTLMHLFLVW
jgi:hypothetical protein